MERELFCIVLVLLVAGGPAVSPPAEGAESAEIGRAHV